MSKLQMYKVKDKAESYYTKKDKLFDLPMRLNIIGKSQFSGKSNTIINLLLRDEFYNKDFNGEDIFIVSPSVKNDDKLKKLIEVKDIPGENIFESFDEELLKGVYELLEEDYNESVENNDRPSNKLIIFDDISFKGDLKKSKGIVPILFCNGRHLNISTIMTSQKYTDISTTARENMTAGIIYSCSDRQLESVMFDHNRLGNKKQFKKMFRDITNQPYSFMVINYTNPFDELYLNKDFQKIDYNKYK